MAEMSPLRQRMIDDMTVRNLSPATQRSYIHAVAKFAKFFKRSPEKLVRGAKLWVRRRRALRTPTTERIRWVKTSEPAPLRLDGFAP